MKYRKNLITLMLIAMISILNACTSDIDSDTQSSTLNVITTTTMLYDLTTVIGGENIVCTGLMGAGIDPHIYTASAGDVTKLNQADVVVYNGIHLEASMGQVLSQLNNKTVICIEDSFTDGDLLTIYEDGEEVFDPHVWFDVSLWSKVAIHIATSLSTADPENAQSYNDNLQGYLQELSELEQYITDRVSELEPEQRVLITAHDAFGYFGNAYNFKVMGIQGMSTEVEASTSDVSTLANFIAENKIKAIFTETSISSKNIQALQEAVSAQGFEVGIGGELYSDSLGDSSTGHDSYIATVKSNIDTIIDALK